MSTYGGDEVSAIVLDVGSYWTRAGYAGEDTPKAVFPTSYGYIEEEISPDSDTQMADAATTSESKPVTKNVKKKYIIGDADVAAWRPNMEIKNPLVDGLIQDWDALEKIWDYAFSNRLRIDPVEHPIFVTECAWNTRDIRERLTELAFEKYNSLAFYVAKNPVLSAFAAGRPTAVVMDCGARSTSCVPVVDGYVLKKGIYKQPIAGDFLSEQLLQQLQQRLEINVVPHYMIAKKTSVDPDQPANVEFKERPNTTNSYHKYMQMRIMQEFKESVCQVSEVTFNHQSINSRPMKYFEFPDGFNTSIGALRFSVPEILFDPRFILQPQDGPNFDTSALMGVPQMIHHSICSCDIDVRPNLLNNIILTGATTLLPGFADRVNHELSNMAPGPKIKLYAAGNTIERKCSSWLGGSILSSLGTFHQLWISRKEYDDYGRGIVEKKCDN